MQIVAGTHRRLKLYSPPNKEIRPTTQLVKEALFSIIGPDIIEASFLDLFAGSGAISLEAKSRGAKTVVAVEQDQTAFKLIKKNQEKIGLDFQVVKLSVEKYVETLSQDFDYIFLDPPYNYENIESLVKLVAQNAPNSTIILEFRNRQHFNIANYNLRVKKYGRTSLYILEKSDDE